MKIKKLHEICDQFQEKYLLVRIKGVPCGINPAIAKIEKAKRDLKQFGNQDSFVESIIRECSFQEYISHKIGFTDDNQRTQQSSPIR